MSCLNNQGQPKKAYPCPECELSYIDHMREKRLRLLVLLVLAITCLRIAIMGFR